jgi:sec-independent protein translocase protein TatB
MSLADTIIILIGALVLFGPKKLPELARQLGKIMGELRRASNEFKFQMEEELRMSEAASRQTPASSQPSALMTPLVAPLVQPPASGDPVVNRVSVRAQDDVTPEIFNPEASAAEPEPAEATPHA